MTQEIIILGVEAVSFTNKNTGEVITGQRIHYTSVEPASMDKKRGFTPISEFIRSATSNDFPAIPGVYHAQFALTTFNGRNQAKIESVKSVKPAKITF